MSKYIDADKLITIIEERKAQQDQWVNRYHDPINQGISQELTEILSITTSLQQEQPETPSGEEVMTMCNQILIDWVKEGKTPEEREQREQAHIRFFELYDEYMQEQPEVDLDAEIAIYLNRNVLNRINNNDIIEDFTTMEAGELARHFYELGLNARKI